MSQIPMLNSEQFSTDVENGQGYVLVDYYADWCGPCKMVAPVLEQLAEEYRDSLSIVKLNADQNPQILGKFGVRGLPTMMLFKDGEPLDTAVGAQPYTALKKFLETHLAA